MKKGKIIFSASAEEFQITSIYINPWNKESDRIMDDARLNAYEGMTFYLRSGEKNMEFLALDEKGKDITDKVKNSDSYFSSNCVPLTLEKRQRKNRLNTNFFGKEKEFVDYDPAVIHSTPSKLSEKIIADTVTAYASNKIDDIQDFYKVLIEKSLCGQTDADMAIEQWRNTPDVSFTVEFEIEFDNKIDLSKLEFFYYNWPEYALLQDFKFSKDTALLGAVVYDRQLYFGKVCLHFNETDKIIIGSELIINHSDFI